MEDLKGKQNTILKQKVPGLNLVVVKSRFGLGGILMTHRKTIRS